MIVKCAWAQRRRCSCKSNNNILLFIQIEFRCPHPFPLSPTESLSVCQLTATTTRWLRIKEFNFSTNLHVLVNTKLLSGPPVVVQAKSELMTVGQAETDAPDDDGQDSKEAATHGLFESHKVQFDSCEQLHNFTEVLTATVE